MKFNRNKEDKIELLASEALTSDAMRFCSAMGSTSIKAAHTMYGSASCANRFILRIPP